jgi:hypothetical protein
MLVYVATPQQIDQAFGRWVNDSSDDVSKRTRRIVHIIYREFMATHNAVAFNTVTGLVSFPLDRWLLSFRAWVNQEIAENPYNASDIRRWSDLLIALLSSDWCIEQKLIVTECLDD